MKTTNRIFMMWYRAEQIKWIKEKWKIIEDYNIIQHDNMEYITFIYGNRVVGWGWGWGHETKSSISHLQKTVADKRFSSFLFFFCLLVCLFRLIVGTLPAPFFQLTHKSYCKFIILLSSKAAKRLKDRFGNACLFMGCKLSRSRDDTGENAFREKLLICCAI